MRDLRADELPDDVADALAPVIERKSRAAGGLFLRSLPVVEGEKMRQRPAYYRLVQPGPILRAAAAEGGMPTMDGHFCVFNRWTHIDSWIEGEFMERIAPGATLKTIKENRDTMKVLFNHGGDPSIGKKVLGPIDELREDEVGTQFAVPMLDTSYNRDLVPGLEKKLYGTSFQFRVMKEQVNQRPDRSDYNPDGIEERTIQEMEVMEFGPVTFPQYTDASVALRSVTDDIFGTTLFNAIASEPERLAQLLGDERMRTLFDKFGPALTTALSHEGAEAGASLDGESRDEDRGEFPPLVVVRNPNKVR